MCTIISIPTNNDKIYKCIDVNVSNKNGLLRINKSISYVYYNKKAVLYKNVFRLVLNAFKLSLSLTDFGRLFQIVGADTANARSPKLLVLEIEHLQCPLCSVQVLLPGGSLTKFYVSTVPFSVLLAAS